MNAARSPALIGKGKVFSKPPIKARSSWMRRPKCRWRPKPSCCAFVTDGQLMRVGSSKPRHVDVRVIAATHRDLSERVRAGLFREDLYYRLAVIPLSIPPLRDRREEIPELCRLFVVQAARDLKVRERKLSSEAISSLLTYDFPGNIRELKNLIERACILSTGDEIGVENFPMTAPNSVSEFSATKGAGSLKPETLAEMMPPAFDLRLVLNELEKALILRVLSATSGARAEAARRLGVSRSDLSYKLAKFGLRTSPD